MTPDAKTEPRVGQPNLPGMVQADLEIIMGQPLAPEHKTNRNPMVRKFGPGPDGVRCGACLQLVRHKPGGKIFYKCLARGVTHGAGTDHGITWDACAMIKLRPNMPPPAKRRRKKEANENQRRGPAAKVAGGNDSAPGGPAD